MSKIQQLDRQPQWIHEPQVSLDTPLRPKTLMDPGLYPANTIDERLLNLFENQEKLREEKDLKIEEQNLKIIELEKTLQEAKKYIPSFQRCSVICPSP